VRGRRAPVAAAVGIAAGALVWLAAWVLDCDSRVAVAWAERLSIHERHDAARALVGTVLAFEPACTEALSVSAQVHYRTARYAEAADDLVRVAAAEPDRCGAHRLLGNARMFLAEHEAAAEAFEDADACRPGSVVVRNLLGLAYYKVGRLEEARAVYDRITAEHPEYIWGWINVALVHARLGDPELAAAAAARAIALDADHPVAHYAAGAVRCVRGEADACLAGVRAALERGYRTWYYIDRDPDLDRNRERQRTQDMQARYKAERAARQAA